MELNEEFTFVTLYRYYKLIIMKKSLIVTLLCTLIFSPAVYACDICGCGVGNFNPHMFPHLSKNFVSLNYYYRHYKTHLHDGGNEENKEYYHTIQLTAQYSPLKKLQLMGALPFQMNRQDGVHGYKTLNQVGDAVILANYRILDAYSTRANVRQTLLAGIGIKLPTGKYRYDHDDEGEVHNANFQAGSGSTDILLNSSYNIRLNKWVMSGGVTFKINGNNQESYRFGDRFLGVLQGKYIKDFGQVSLIPNFGISYEKLEMDKSHGVIVDHTGGYSFQANAGIDINNRRWAAGFLFQQPLSNKLAGGHIHAMPGLNFHLSYSL
jgi:hypothetical protein